MSGGAFLELATIIGLLMVGAGAVLTLVRLVLGPTLADRVMALDALSTLATTAIVIFAIQTGFTLYLDLAIALTLIGFLGTAALARYVLSRGSARRDNLSGEQ